MMLMYLRTKKGQRERQEKNLTMTFTKEMHSDSSVYCEEAVKCRKTCITKATNCCPIDYTPLMRNWLMLRKKGL
jgi:hypothetical protein